MRRLKRWWIGLAFFAFVAAILHLNLKDMAAEEGASAVKGDATFLEQVMSGVHLVETAGGAKEWELWAEKALSFKGKGSWNVQQVRVVFFTDDGVEFLVTGDRGTIQMDTKDMFIEGNVVTTTSNDYKFYTHAMLYRSGPRELNTAHPVRIVSPPDEKGFRMRLTGVGLLAQMNDNKIYVHKNVRGAKPVDAERSMKIRSHEAQMNARSRSATFIGDVVMDVDDMTITGPKARFNYAHRGNYLKTINVLGGVKVSDQFKWATSKTLDILVPQDKFIFKGDPRVVQNNDEILGETIIFLNGGKQVQVMSGQASLSEKRSKREL